MSRELDAKVATKVMGWRQVEEYFGSSPTGRFNWCCGTKKYIDFVPYSTDVKWDYEVLKHVREKWTREQQDKFAEACDDVMAVRCTPNSQWWCIAYEPGDWSKAALKALGEEVG